MRNGTRGVRFRIDWRMGVVALAVAMLAASLAMAAEPKTFADFEGDAKAWKGTKIVTEPVHGGKQALQWDVAARPVLDCPKGENDWSAYKTISFWVYSDKKYDFKVYTVFVADQGYFMKTFTVDFTGWKKITIDMAKAGKAHGAKDWKNISHMGFRAKGYDLPPIPKGMKLVIDDIELEPAK